MRNKCEGPTFSSPGHKLAPRPPAHGSLTGPAWREKVASASARQEYSPYENRTRFAKVAVHTGWTERIPSMCYGCRRGVSLACSAIHAAWERALALS